MQDNYHSLLALRRVEGKGIGLFADSPIDNGDLVAQYVGEVITRQMYIDREKVVRYQVSMYFAVSN